MFLGGCLSEIQYSLSIDQKLVSEIGFCLLVARRNVPLMISTAEFVVVVEFMIFRKVNLINLFKNFFKKSEKVSFKL